MTSLRVVQRLVFGLATGLVVGLASAAMADPVAATPDASKINTTTPQSKEVKAAIERFQGGDFEGALTNLKLAAKENKDLPPAQIMMAQLFAQAQRAADVRTSLERAVIDDEADPEAYVIMAEVAVMERRITEADLLLNYAKSALQNFTRSETRKNALIIRSEAGLAAVCEAREKWEEAQKYLKAWIAADAKSAAAHQRLARVLFQLKSTDAAVLAELKKAQELDKNSLTPEAVLARFYQARAESGDSQKAETWMATALKAAPKDFATLMSAAQLAAETSTFNKAKDYAAAALEVNKESIDAKLTLGVVNLLLKDYPAAEKLFYDALQQSPSNFAASNNLALALAEQKEDAKKMKALEYAAVNVRQFPKQAEGYSTLGWVYYKLGKLDEAEQSLRTAASSGQLSPDTAYYLAKVLVDRDKKSDARTLLNVALKSKALFTMRKEAKELLDSIQ